VAVVDAAGKLHRQSVYAANEREAKRRLRELIAQRDAGITAPSPRETMARFLMSWLEGVKPTLRPRSLGSLRGAHPIAPHSDRRPHSARPPVAG
jgi:hypothetical protein